MPKRLIHIWIMLWLIIIVGITPIIHAQGVSMAADAEKLDALGQTYYQGGKYPQALECFQKSLSIYLKALGPEHPSTAISYHNIGRVYSKMEDYSKALENYTKALSIELKALGPEHPSTAISYNNIGKVYSKMEDYSKALENYTKAL
ncbi:MAG: tetratricopeptide repeat protein, partial [Deltaproteobacteria bacterium]|nr:tetratricopeptide repeat protein [Deltaproteobacteria bacterium]